MSDVLSEHERKRIAATVEHCIIDNPITVTTIIDVINTAGALSRYGIKSEVVLRTMLLKAEKGQYPYA